MHAIVQDAIENSLASIEKLLDVYDAKPKRELASRPPPPLRTGARVSLCQCSRSASSRAWTSGTGASSRACGSWGCATRATPSSCARATTREGADEITLLDITASHEGRGTLLDVVARDGRRHVRAAHRRRRRPRGGRRARAARRGRRQGEHQHGRRRRRRSSSRRCSDAWGVAGDRRGHRREDAARTAAGWEVFVHGGRTATGLDVAARGPRRRPRLGAGEILLTSMDRDGTLVGLRPRAHARRVRRRPRPGHRQRRRRDRSSTCARASSRATRARSSRRASSTTARAPIAEVKRVPRARGRARAPRRRRGARRMSGGALDASVTLDEVFAVVGTKRVPLAPELAGYLVLEIAEHADPSGGDVDPRSVFVGEEGTVALVKPQRDGATGDAEASDPRRRSRACSRPAARRRPALAAASKRKSGAGLPALAEELEAALIPVNRAAGRRALARLAREVQARHARRRPQRAALVERRGRRGAVAPRRLRARRHRGRRADAAAARPRACASPQLLARGGADDRARPDPRGGAEEGHARARRLERDADDAVRARRSDAVALAGRRRLPHRATSASREAASSSTRATLKAMAGLEPTPPPPPRSSAHRDARASAVEGGDSGVESLLAMGASAPAREPSGAPRAATASPRRAPARRPACARAATRQLPTRAVAADADARFTAQHRPRRSTGAARARRGPRWRSSRSAAGALRASGSCARGRVRHAGRGAFDRSRRRRARGRAPPCTGNARSSTDVPPHAEVLLRAGQAPVDVEKMPVGARLEFVATAEGYAPKRVVVPAGAAGTAGRTASRASRPPCSSTSPRRTRGQRPVARRRAGKRGRRAGPPGHGARRGDAAGRRGVDARGHRARGAHRAARTATRTSTSSSPGPTTFRKRLHVAASRLRPPTTPPGAGRPARRPRRCRPARVARVSAK